MYPSIISSGNDITPMGHELVGNVVETGDKVKGIKPGDRVVCNPLTHCSSTGFKECPSCRNKNFQHCYSLTGIGDGSKLEEAIKSKGKLGGFGGGGFSEYMVGFEGQFYKVLQHPSYRNRREAAEDS